MLVGWVDWIGWFVWLFDLCVVVWVWCYEYLFGVEWEVFCCWICGFVWWIGVVCCVVVWVFGLGVDVCMWFDVVFVVVDCLGVVWFGIVGCVVWIDWLFCVVGVGFGLGF